MWPHFDRNIQDVYTAYRLTIRRLWCIPWLRHNTMLAHVARVMDPESWFANRCIQFIKKITVCTIRNMGRYN